jgi:hypothetical protein
VAQQRDLAEEIKLALVGSRHDVFFDRDSLPSGYDYDLRIRKAVAESDVFVFLISPQSVARGCYALTELRYAREKWPDPRGKVLPVMIEKTDYREIPPYLKGGHCSRARGQRCGGNSRSDWKNRQQRSPARRWYVEEDRAPLY